MRYKFVIFGHEIQIRPKNDTRFRIDKNAEFRQTLEEPKWELTFPMEKRVNVYAQYKGFISYVFRSYDMALLNCGEPAFFHLEAILRSFADQRKKFEIKGANPEQLKSFDDCIYSCFKTTIDNARNKALELEKKQSEDLQAQIEIVKKLEEFKIDDYYKTQCLTTKDR